MFACLPIRTLAVDFRRARSTRRMKGAWGAYWIKETEMLGKTQRTCALAALVLSAGGTVAAAGPAAAVDASTSPALERFKALAGEWVAAEDNEMVKKGELVARYAVTAGGSAVVETVFPGREHEMVTVYHADGPDLVLTHYCIEGNQPRMRARNAQGPRFDFAYDGGTSIDPQHDRHMHSASLALLGPDEIRSEWTELADGKPVLVVKSHLVRSTR
jgi:hypothetical protein